MRRAVLRVLMYHRVLDRADLRGANPSLLSATPATFRRQMDYLARTHRVLHLDEVLACVRGEQSLPKRAVLITFDDAYRDFGELAWPILRSLSLPATLFVPTGFPDRPERVFWWDRLHLAVSTTRRTELDAGPVGRFPLDSLPARRAALHTLQTSLKRLPRAETLPLVESIWEQLAPEQSAESQVLGWDELRDLAREGVSLAPHTRTHASLDCIGSEEDLRAEVRGSIDDLRREIGVSPPVFAYPFGRHDAALEPVLQSEGIELAMTCRAGHNRLPLREPLRLRRTNITPRTTPLLFPLRLSSSGGRLDRWRTRGREVQEPAPVAEPEGGGLRVAYIMSRFPKISETFVLYEMAALESMGADVRLYPLLRERQPVAHPEAERWVRRAQFHPFVSLAILRSNLAFLLEQPRRYLALWFEVLSCTAASPRFFVGAFGTLPKAIRFAHELRDADVEHVHAHFATHPAVAALAIHRLTGIPFSFTAHGSDLHVDRTMLDRKIAAAAFAVTVSDYNREVMVRECGESLRSRIHVIRCGADPEIFMNAGAAGQGAGAGRPPGPLRIVCVASLEEVKGHRFLIEACARLRRRGVEFRCELIGAGPLEADLRRQIREAGLDDCVRLTGAQPRPAVVQALNEADVAVLASHPTRSGKREGIPVALMEAMACGLPVVASRLSGIPELVRDGQSGLLVPSGQPAALADAIQHLAEDPELRLAMGRVGRAIVLHHYNLRRNARQLHQLFRAAAAARPTTSPAIVGRRTESEVAMSLHASPDLEVMGRKLRALRPPEGVAADVAVVVPVNAQGDLENVLNLLGDVARYRGPESLEVLLVVNNYPEGQPPAEVERFRELGVQVLAIPNVRVPGEDVCFSARIPGMRQATAECVVLLDADCRIPDITALLNWYAAQFRKGAQAAYTPVGHYDYANAWSIKVRFAIHHTSRWIKRVLLGIPTTRGSNYAVRRTALLELYEQGVLADAIHVGPAFKRLKGRVAYSGARELTVYTSGRMFNPGWRSLLPYFMYRLRYNLRTLPVRGDAARYTGRENDPVRRYVGNRPVRGT